VVSSWQKAQLVEAQPVDVVLLEVHARVAEEEGAHSGAVEGEHAPTGPALRREVQVVLAVGGDGEVEVVEALRVQTAARVVVHDVGDHGDPVQVAEVDERLELVHLAAEVVDGERRAAFLREERVRGPQVRAEVGRADAVVHLRGEDVGPVVAEAPLPLVLDEREGLYGGHAQVCEVFDPVEHVEELRDPVRPEVCPGPVARVEHPEMELVDHELARRGRPELGVVPGVQLAVAYEAVAVGVSVQLELARPRVPLEARPARALDEVAVRRPVAHSRHIAGPDPARRF